MGPVVPAVISTWRTSRYTIVELPAQIDLSNANDLYEHLLGLIDGSVTGPLVADLTGTRFCDSSGVNALLRVHTRATELGRRMYAAVHPDGTVRRVFDITAVPQHIPTCDDLGSTIAMAVVAALDDSGGPH